MTATYDPTDPKYFDPAALREEVDRVFDLCHGCRLCFNLCPSFPTLFSFIDANDGDVVGPDRRRARPGRRRVLPVQALLREVPLRASARVGARLPAPHEPGARGAPEEVGRPEGAPDRPVPGPHRRPGPGLGRGGTGGQLGHRHAGLLAAPGHGEDGGHGVASGSCRRTPGSASRRGSRGGSGQEPRRGPAGAVSVFPTCFVEYMEPDVGRAIVEVYEHNGVACALPEGTKCCGAPWLHSGQVEEFTKAARRNVAALAAEVRAGRDVIVAQPTCAYVVKRDYPIYAKGADAELVAAHTFDPAEYLMRRHRDARRRLHPARRVPRPRRRLGARRRDLPRGLPPAGPEHRACAAATSSRWPGSGAPSSSAARASTGPGATGPRTTSWPARWRRRWAGRSRQRAMTVVCGDCHLANGSILQETGTRPDAPDAAHGARLRRAGPRARGISGDAGTLEPARPGLTLDDVLDLRAYERVRDDYRATGHRTQAQPAGRPRARS